MSYNYGQYRYDGNYLNYVTRLKTEVNNVWEWNFYYHGDNNNEIDDIQNYGILYGEHQLPFYDKILRIQNNRTGFQSGETYYIRFKVQRLYGAIQQFSVGLLDYSNEDQPIASQKLEDYTMIKGKTDSYQTFELVFTPNQNYDSMLFEYKRSSVDYNINEEGEYEGYEDTRYRSETIWTNGNSSTEIICGRHMTLEILQLCKLKNVISLMDNNDIEIVKLGIQAPPGTLLGINGEQIKVGGNGIYEINNKLITIDKVNVVPVDTNNLHQFFFIIDYEYNINNE